MISHRASTSCSTQICFLIGRISSAGWKASNKTTSRLRRFCRKMIKLSCSARTSLSIPMLTKRQSARKCKATKTWIAPLMLARQKSAGAPWMTPQLGLISSPLCHEMIKLPIPRRLLLRQQHNELYSSSFSGWFVRRSKQTWAWWKFDLSYSRLGRLTRLAWQKRKSKP